MQKIRKIQQTTPENLQICYLTYFMHVLACPITATKKDCTDLQKEMTLRYYTIKNPASCLTEIIVFLHSRTRILLDQGFVHKFYNNIFHFSFSENLNDKIFEKMQKKTYLALFAQNGTNENFIGIFSFVSFQLSKNLKTIKSLQ